MVDERNNKTNDTNSSNKHVVENESDDNIDISQDTFPIEGNENDANKEHVSLSNVKDNGDPTSNQIAQPDIYSSSSQSTNQDATEKSSKEEKENYVKDKDDQKQEKDESDKYAMIEVQPEQKPIIEKLKIKNRFQLNEALKGQNAQDNPQNQAKIVLAEEKSVKENNAKEEISNVESTWQADFPPLPQTMEKSPNHTNKNISSFTSTSSTLFNGNTTTTLTESEIELCQIIDLEYDRSLESLNILLKSKYASFRQSAFFSIFFFVMYLIFGTLFYTQQDETNWKVEQALLFLIYSITTVGYGSHTIPTTPGFQLFTIFYIILGIAALTIAVAQAYNWIALEAARTQYARDKAEIKRRVTGGNNNNDEAIPEEYSSNHLRESIRYVMEFSDMNPENQNSVERCIDYIGNKYDLMAEYLRNTSTGRIISIFLPLGFLVLLGAIVVAPIEKWTFMEGIYWAVVTLTTVGFGQYYPTKDASIWFCIFYLPFSIGFMSIFLSNVARFYIHMNNSNIIRIQSRMWNKLIKEKQKETNEREHRRNLKRNHDEQNQVAGMSTPRKEVSTQDVTFAHESQIPQDRTMKNMPEGYDSLAPDPGQGSKTHSWFGSADSKRSVTTTQDGLKRREKVLELQQISFTSSSTNRTPSSDIAMYSPGDYHERTQNLQPSSQQKMTTMKVVLNAIKLEMKQRRTHNSLMPDSTLDFTKLPETSFLAQFDSNLDNSAETSLETGVSSNNSAQTKKPSFILRALVQERMAYIIANDIAGYQSLIESQENVFSVTIDTFKVTCDKWMIPRKARKAFQSVAFQAIFFVGERNLIVNGADALLELGPLEFHGLFPSLLVAMGDSFTMEEWLASTDVLSDVELKKKIVGAELNKAQMTKDGTPISTPKPRRRRLWKKNDGVPTVNVSLSEEAFEIL